MIAPTTPTTARRAPDSRSRPCEPEPDVCCEPGRAPAAFCRPRFFAGQLLTETDLNRLDYYIRGKNRLHTLHLHGWGVVGGLEVRCDPCDCRHVTVSPGYAIGPCGDDIVVPATDVVDVCDLIQDVCRGEREDARCEPLRTVPRYEGCDEERSDWILAVCYREEPTRGVTALRHSGDGCGCTEPMLSPAPPSRTACEPTQLCEGYDYLVYRAPDQAPSRGRLVDRLLCCIQPYLDMTLLQTTRQPTHNASDMRSDLVDLRRQLHVHFAANPGMECGLLRRLDAVVISDDRETWAAALRELVVIWFLGLLECVCSVLLPPNPEPVDGLCVPLARITVGVPATADDRRGARGGCVEDECCIERVCNWTTERRVVLSPAVLGYWLSPLRPLVRGAMEAVCCELPQRFDGFLQDDAQVADDSQIVEEMPEVVVTGRGAPSPPRAADMAAAAEAAEDDTARKRKDALRQAVAGLDLQTLVQRAARGAAAGFVTPEAATAVFYGVARQYRASGRQPSALYNDLAAPLAVTLMPSAAHAPLAEALRGQELGFRPKEPAPEVAVAEIEAQIEALRGRLDAEMTRARSLRSEPAKDAGDPAQTPS